MTEEQIKGFRDVAIEVARATGRTGSAKVMERLLEERKRLLDGLRTAKISLSDARATLSACWGLRIPPPHHTKEEASEAEGKAADAIAFAEEAAP